MLVLMAALFGAGGWQWWQRRSGRPVTGLVKTIVEDEQPTTVVISVYHRGAAVVVLAALAAMVTLWPVSMWHSARGVALVLSVVAAYSWVAVPYLAAGRLGYQQTLRLTPEGLSQNANGWKVSAQWSQIRSLAMVPGAVLLQVDGTAEHKRLAPAAWVGRKKHRSGSQAVIHLTLIHHALRVPVAMAIERACMDPTSRGQIGTPQLARELLLESQTER